MCSICALASMTGWEQPEVALVDFFFISTVVFYTEEWYTEQSGFFLIESTCYSLLARTNLSQS